MKHRQKFRTLYFAKDRAKNKHADFLDILKSCTRTRFIIQYVDEDENNWILHGVDDAVY